MEEIEVIEITNKMIDNFKVYNLTEDESIECSIYSVNLLLNNIEYGTLMYEKYSNVKRQLLKRLI